MSQRKAVIVTLADDQQGDMEGLVQRLRSAGLESPQALGALGQVTGYVAPGSEQALRNVPGVSSVDESTDYQLPPPDAPIQ